MIFCALACAHSAFYALSFIRAGGPTASRIGCKFLSEALLYLVLGIGLAGPFLEFTHDAWMGYRTVLCVVVAAGLLTTYRLSKEG